MQSFPIISHVDILFSIFKDRELMSTFSVNQLERLKRYIEMALEDKSIEVTNYDLLEDD